MQCAIVCWCRIFECCHGWCTCCLRWRLWKMQLVFQAARVSWTCEINVTGLRRWNLRKAAGLCEITACIWPTTASTRSLPTTSRQYCHLCLSVCLSSISLVMWHVRILGRIIIELSVHRVNHQVTGGDLESPTYHVAQGDWSWCTVG